MTQTSWLSDGTTRFRFFTNADGALITYLQTYAPNDLAALILADANTLQRNVLTTPAADLSKSLYPVVYVWTTQAEDAYHAPPSPMVRCVTRFLVFALNVDIDDMAHEVQSLCGAIAAAVQQTRDTTGNDWADFYCNFDLPEVAVGPIEFVTTGADSGLVRGTVTATWTHEE